MPLDILKGFLIGICASVPLGPIAILVLQKSLCNGHKAGFITGLGATTVDTTFALLAIFALSYAQRLIDAHEGLVMICGGIVVAIIGMTVFFNAREPILHIEQDNCTSFTIKDYLKAVAVGYSNPGAILVMFGLFAFFGIDTQLSGFHLAPVVVALSLGSASYWFCFSWALSRVGKKLNVKVLMYINRIAGVALALVGAFLVVRGLLVF